MNLFGTEKLRSGVKVFKSSMLFHFHLPLKNRMVTCVKTCVKTKLGLGRRRSNGSREEFDYRKHLQKRDSQTQTHAVLLVQLYYC